LLPAWLFVFALGVRLLLASILGFDGLYGQDAFAYVGCAHGILQMHWGQVPCGDFYWPLGYPLLAGLFMLVTHSEAFGAQLASAVAGAAIAPLVYWLAIEAGVAVDSGVAVEAGVAGTAPRGAPSRRDATSQRDARSSGVAAGLIAALCGTLMLSSIVAMSDAPGLFWATLSACLLLRWERLAGRPPPPAGASARAPTSTRGDGFARSVWLILAAVTLALAVITRWIFAGLLLPFGLFAALATLRELRAARSEGRGLLRRSVAALLPWAVAALAFALIVVPQLYINGHSGHPVSSDGWVVSWNAANAWRTSFDTPSGHFAYRLPPFIFFAEPLFHPAYIFPLLTVCLLWGAWQLRGSPALILLGGWIVTLYLYLIGTPQENMRFGLAFFPPVAVLTGIGIFCMPMRSVNTRSTARWVLLGISLVAAIPFSYRVIASFDSAAALQVAAIRYVQSRLPPAATVVTFELSISLQHYSDFTVVDLFAQSPDSLRRLVCGNAGAYLYVDGAKLESQWAGKSPAEGFHWLRDRIGLTKMGQQGAWTLYRISACSQ